MGFLYQFGRRKEGKYLSQGRGTDTTQTIAIQ